MAYASSNGCAFHDAPAMQSIVTKLYLQADAGAEARGSAGQLGLAPVWQVTGVLLNHQ